MRRSSIALGALWLCLTAWGGLPENPQGNNKALLVGVSQGLPGLSLDIDRMKAILSHPSNGFTYEILRDSEGTVSGIAKKLTELSAAVDSRGSFLFTSPVMGIKASFSRKTAP